MYTATVVDTVTVRALGAVPDDHLSRLADALREADQQLLLTPTVYAELGGDPSASSSPSGSPFVDGVICQELCEVTGRVPGSRPDEPEERVESARHDAHEGLPAATNHPTTANEWADTSIVGLIVRLFE